MVRRGEENADLPGFFQDNPWLDILAQGRAEPMPDFMASEASFATAVGRTTPVIEPEPIATSSTTTPLVASLPKELVVRLEVWPYGTVKKIKYEKHKVTLKIRKNRWSPSSYYSQSPLGNGQKL